MKRKKRLENEIEEDKKKKERRKLAEEKKKEIVKKINIKGSEKLVGKPKSWVVERKKNWRGYREKKKCESWSEENDSSDKEGLDEVIEFGSKFNFNFDFSKTIWSTRLVPHPKTKPKVIVTKVKSDQSSLDLEQYPPDSDFRGSDRTGNKLGLGWAKLSHNWGLKLEFEVKV